MSQTHLLHSLYLYPADPSQPPPDLEPVRSVLQSTGFIGQQFGVDRYLVGEQFLQWLSFAGCSPHIVLEPKHDADLDFTHVSLKQGSSQLMFAQHRARPRCPACRNPIKDWKELVEDWQAEPQQSVCCPICNQTSPLWQMDWRGYGLVANCWVEVHRIYPGEAVPNDDLLAQLQQATGHDWRYAWALQST